MQTLELLKLPKGWATSRLEDISLSIVGGGTPSRKHDEYFGGDIVWLTPTEVPKEKITVVSDSKEKITKEGFENSSVRLVPAGSVLLTSRASIGHVAIAGCELTTNQGFASFVCSDAIYNVYLAYWLWSNKRILEQKAGGTTFKEISKAKLREMLILLPPLNEQKRIVSKIEELFTKLDAGIEYLKKARLQLKRYRQSVLKAAFEGKLTEEWRKRQVKDTLQPARNFPTDWVFKELGQITSPSKLRCEPSESSEEPFVGLEHIESGTGQILGIGNSSSLKSSKTRFSEGDILYGRLRPYLNKVWVATFSGICSTDILVFSRSDSYESSYLGRFLSTPDFVRYATQNMKGVQHPRVSFQTISQYQIPLPSLVEQKEIVQQVERSLSICYDTDAVISKNLVQAQKLRQSILKQAFEGNLVPQDPDDEPAEKLLARIKKERENQSGSSVQQKLIVGV